MTKDFEKLKTRVHPEPEPAVAEEPTYDGTMRYLPTPFWLGRCSETLESSRKVRLAQAAFCSLTTADESLSMLLVFLFEVRKVPSASFVRLNTVRRFCQITFTQARFVVCGK